MNPVTSTVSSAGAPGAGVLPGAPAGAAPGAGPAFADVLRLLSGQDGGAFAAGGTEAGGEGNARLGLSGKARRNGGSAAPEPADAAAAPVADESLAVGTMTVPVAVNLMPVPAPPPADAPADGGSADDVAPAGTTTAALAEAATAVTPAAMHGGYVAAVAAAGAGVAQPLAVSETVSRDGLAAASSVATTPSGGAAYVGAPAGRVHGGSAGPAHGAPARPAFAPAPPAAPGLAPLPAAVAPPVHGLAPVPAAVAPPAHSSMLTGLPAAETAEQTPTLPPGLPTQLATSPATGQPSHASASLAPYLPTPEQRPTPLPAAAPRPTAVAGDGVETPPADAALALAAAGVDASTATAPETTAAAVPPAAAAAARLMNESPRETSRALGLPRPLGRVADDGVTAASPLPAVAAPENLPAAVATHATPVPAAGRGQQVAMAAALRAFQQAGGPGEGAGPAPAKVSPEASGGETTHMAVPSPRAGATVEGFAAAMDTERRPLTMPALIVPAGGDLRVSGLAAGPRLEPAGLPVLAAGDGEAVQAQIVQSLRVQWTGGAGEARVRLRPDYLGEVVATIKVEQGAVTATLQADRPEVRRWMEANTQTLRDGLVEHGLKLDRLVILSEPARGDSADDNQGRPRGRQPQPQPPPRPRRPRQDDEPATFAVNP